PIDHVCYVAALAEKLHYFLAGSSHLRPARFRFGILLKSSNLVPFEREIHLMQVALWSETNMVTLCAKHDLVGVIDEDLPPNFNEYLFEGNRHGKQARCSSLSIQQSRQIYFCTSMPCGSLTTISGALSRKSGGS